LHLTPVQSDYRREKKACLLALDLPVPHAAAACSFSETFLLAWFAWRNCDPFSPSAEIPPPAAACSCQRRRRQQPDGWRPWAAAVGSASAVVSCCRCTLLVPGGGGGGGVGLLIGRLVGGYSRVRWRSGPLLLLRAVGGRVRDCVPGIASLVAELSLPAMSSAALRLERNTQCQ